MAAYEVGRPSSGVQRLAFAGITIAVALFVTLGVVEMFCRILMPHWREFLSERFMTIREIPGYMTMVTGRPGFDGFFSQNNGDFRVRVSINADGHRTSEPISAASGRLWAIGDSFTFGWGVEEARRFPEVAASALSIAVYNLASPGADVCGYRALRAMMPADAVPRAVVVGLTLENDVADYDCAALFTNHALPIDSARWSWPSLSDTKQFLMTQSALYNFAAVSVKRMPAANDWLKRVGLVSREHDYRRSFGLPDIPRFAQRTADELFELRKSFAATTPFAVLIVPARFDLLTQDPFYRTLRQTMVAEILARHIDVLDPYDDLAAAGFARTHFSHDGHWSEGGHRVAGQLLETWLRHKSVN